MIDQLIQLSRYTRQYFGTQGEEKNDAYIQYLTFVKGIALDQLENKKISDETFEKLRLYDQQLNSIMSSTPYFGQTLQKEGRGSLIADIFNSATQGQLYEAIGRPQLLLMMIDDVNGKRVVLGPVYTHYEFYTNEDHDISSEKGRFVDHERQNQYDEHFQSLQKLMSLPIHELKKEIK